MRSSLFDLLRSCYSYIPLRLINSICLYSFIRIKEIHGLLTQIFGTIQNMLEK